MEEAATLDKPSKLTSQSWEDLLKRITYKRGYKIHYDYDIDVDEHRLLVEMQVEDTYNPGRLTSVINRHLVPRFELIGEEHALDIIRLMLQDLELHELDEWLKLDGTIINDPHAPNWMGI